MSPTKPKRCALILVYRSKSRPNPTVRQLVVGLRVVRCSVADSCSTDVVRIRVLDMRLCELVVAEVGAGGEHAEGKGQSKQLRRLYHLFGCGRMTWGMVAVEEAEEEMGASFGRAPHPVRSVERV